MGDNKRLCNLGNLANLPDDLLLSILSFLPMKNLVRDIALVNHKFHNLCVDPALWRKLSLPPDHPGCKLDHFTAIQLIERCTQLKKLRVWKRSDGASLIIKALHLYSKKKLNDVLICFNRNSSLDQALFLDNIGQFDKIKRVTVCGHLEQTVFKKYVGCLKYVTAVNIFCNSQVSGDILCNIVSKSCQNLEIFAMAMSYISDEGMITFLTFFNHSLKELKLNLSDCTSLSVNKLFMCLNLRRLELWWPRDKMVNGSVVSKILELRHLNDLKIGCHNDNKLTPLDIAMAFHKKVDLKLEILCLYWMTELNDMCLELISNSCKCMKSLVITGTNQFTCAGLSKLVFGCIDLRYLVIDVCRGILSFTDAFKNAKVTLVAKLFIPKTEVQKYKNELEEIKEQLSGVNIVEIL